MKRVFSGIQPSGNLTLGNYLGAIQNWVPLQDQYECLFCIVDLHALTVPQDPIKLKQTTQELAALYIASGIDPSKSQLFKQSAVPAHTELTWLLSCSTPLGWLNRMTQFKDKAGKHREQASLGLYAYPVLMAADILLYKTTHVPVGEDQKQHLELARDIAQAFNHTHKTDTFILPEPLIQGPAPRVMSLRDGTKKMSKSDVSDFSRINLLDDNQTIALKIRKAKTDPLPLPEQWPELENRFEAKNLITMYAALAHCSKQQALDQFKGKDFSDFKPALTDLIISILEPIRVKAFQLLEDTTALENHLEKGKTRATEISEQTLREVRPLFGLS